MSKLKRNCNHCNTEFETTEYRINEGRGKFCCRQHANLFKTGKPIPGIQKISRICVYCGKTFNTNKWKIVNDLGKFCSQNCYWKFKKGKPSPTWSRIKIKCTQCYKEFFVTKKRAESGAAKFCSRHCYAITRRGKSGPTKGYKHTAEQRKAMSIAQKKRFEIKPVWNKGTKGVMTAWNKGKPHTAEHIKNSSEAHMKINFNDVLAQREFKLLSPYVNTHTKVKLQCKLGHDFENTPAHIKSGQRCGICSPGVSERICRAFFEAIFKQKFPRVRPVWLQGKKGFPLELDGYSEPLRLAFEYQGRQHYEHNTFFHVETSLEQRREDDKLKKQLCEAHDVILIEIPWTIPFDKMQEYITKQCEKRNIHPVKIDKLDYNSFEICSIDKLREFQEIAISKKGLCLSKKYINNSTPLRFQCEKGHSWSAVPYSIRVGTWCRICAGLAKGTIEEIRIIAKSNGFECLSDTYVNSQTCLLFRCGCGNEWRATPNNIKRGRRCPRCKWKRLWETRRKNQKE